MNKIEYYFSLDPKWQDKLGQDLSLEIFNNGIIMIPEKIGKGSVYFTKVLPGVSVLFVDFTVTSPLVLHKLRSEEEFYILHFNLSDYIDGRMEPDDDNEANNGQINLNLRISSNQTDHVQQIVPDKRIFGISLFVSNVVMDQYVDSISNKESIKKILLKSSICHYDYIDSKSLILGLSIAKFSSLDKSFEFYIKGISLKLLSNFLTRNFESPAYKHLRRQLDIDL